MKRLRTMIGGLLAALAAASSAAAGEPITTTDLLRVRSISSVTVARDGATAVVAVRSIGRVDDDAARGGAENAVTKDVSQSHLFLIDLLDEDATARQLTYGDRYDHDPRFSPDGRQIAFVRGVDDQLAPGSQVWVMPVDGGEARPVTDLQFGAGAPRWAPEGRRLLVTSRVPLDARSGIPAWPSERPNRAWKDVKRTVTPRPDGTKAEIRAWLARNAAQNDPNVINRIGFQDERMLRGSPAFHLLYVIDVHDPEAEPVRISDRFVDHVDAVFMPDGESVVFSAKKELLRHPDRQFANALYRTTLEGRETTELLALEGLTLREPRPTHDGGVIAYIAQQVDEPVFRQRRLGISAVTVDGVSEPTWLTEPDTLDASVDTFQWLSTKPGMIFTVARHGGFPLMTTSPSLLEPATLVDEVDGLPVGVHAFGADGGAIVYSLTSATNPCVLRVRDVRGDRLLWDLNAWVGEKELSKPSMGWVTRADGVKVQYWLMEPTQREARKSHPLALEIHGGPGGMWGPGELTMWHEFQLLCSWGYAVVYANPRGSGGYGYEFQKANYRNWGAGPADDVLAVVDEVALHEWIDEDRMVVTGGSYGGYLTAWIIGHDHRFKAAVAQRGVYDLTTFFGEGNAWRLAQWAMGGNPWDPRVKAVFGRESPFTYVNRIRTPLLIMHASRDLRTGVSQSEMLYRALKELGRPVEYVRYPAAGHDLSRSGDPHQRMDRLNRILEFFDRFIENPRPAP